MEENGRNKFLRIIKRILIVAVVVVIVFVVAGYSLAKLYGGRIEQLVVTEINKNLNTEVSVKDISFSLLKDFPYATLLLNNVVAVNNNEKIKNDTLLNAGSLFLNFNIIDLIRKNYILKHIVLKDAILKLQIYNDNSDNFHFLKTSEEQINSSFSLNLNKVSLKNVHLNYNNLLSEQDYSILVKDAVLRGLFSENKYSLKIEGDLLAKKIESSKTIFLSDQDVYLELSLNVDEVNKRYQIEKGEVHLDDLVFDVKGSITHNEKDNNIDLNITGQDLDVSSFVNILPEKYKTRLRSLSVKGRFYIYTSLNGKFGSDNSPSVLAEFSFKKGKIIHNKTSVSVDDVSFEGKFTNGNAQSLVSSSIEIGNLSARLKKGFIKGNLRMKNFVDPQIEFVSESEFDLGDLHDLIKPDTIQSMSGKLETKLAYKGKLRSMEGFTPKGLISNTASGNMKIKDVSYQLAGDDKIYKNINGEISFSNNDLVVNRLDVEVAGCDFMIQGYFRNFLPYLFNPGENLFVEAELNSREIKLDKLLARDAKNTDKGYKLNFSEKLDLELDFNVQELTFQKFRAENISGRIVLDDRILSVSSLYLQAEEGITNARGYIDGTRDDKLFITCDASIRDVNVQKLFYEFENFGQSGLTDRNIKGTVDADVEFSGVWSSSLKVDPASIYTKADLIIENGALVDYPPLMGLSDHIRDADLTTVKFSTLKNQIEIKDKLINIPEMEIESDAINISASGTHKFNNEINYRLKVLWSELRSRKNKNDESEFGVVIDDGLQKTTLFFVITGTVDNPIVKYDKQGLKEKIKSDLKKEKKNLKDIFKQEFSKEGSEKIENSRIKKQEEGEFIIEWEENETDSVGEKMKTKKSDNPQIFIKWDEEEDENDTVKKK